MSNKQQNKKPGQYHPSFDELLTLAKDDPALFETKRLEYIERFFTKIPPDRQRRLRGLQWQIDQARKLARTPMSSCMNIMTMMWDSLHRLNDHQRELVKLTAIGRPSSQQKSVTYSSTSPDCTVKGEIIHFPAR